MGPKTVSSGDPFFQDFRYFRVLFWARFRDPLRVENCKQSCTFGSFWSPAWGPKWVRSGGTFFNFFVIFRFIFWNAVCSQNLVFCNEKQRFWASFWAPKRSPLETLFFKIFVIFKTLFGSKNANSRLKNALFAPQIGALKNCFFQDFLDFYFGSMLVPSWPHLGLILASLGSSWPLLASPGIILAPFWLHLDLSWPPALSLAFGLLFLR